MRDKMGKNIEEVAAHYIIPTCSSEPTLSQEASLSHSPSLYLSLNTSLSSFPLSLPLHSTVPFSFSAFLLPPSFPPPCRCLVILCPTLFPFIPLLRPLSPPSALHVHLYIHRLFSHWFISSSLLLNLHT